MNRRRFLSVALPAMALAGCSRSEPTPSVDRSKGASSDTSSTTSTNPERLKLAIGKTTGVLCLVDWAIASEKGFFSAEGLDVEYLEQDWSKFHGHHLMSDWLTGPAGPVRCAMARRVYA